MAYDQHLGTGRLARVLKRQMKEMATSPLVLDYGTINDDMSLRTNTFPINIPKEDYMVCRQLTLGKKNEKLTETTVNGSYSHKHEVLIPESMRKLKPGDRVLVAWIEEDACVIDIIVPAKVL